MQPRSLDVRRVLISLTASLFIVSFVTSLPVFAQAPSPPAGSPSPSPTTTPDAGISKEEELLIFKGTNDIQHYDDKCEPGSGGSSAPATGAGSDCKGEPLPDTIPEYWRNLIDNAAAKYPDTDRRLVAATLWIENRGWPDPNKSWATSSASAKGPWQFIPSSWASMGTDCNNDGVTDVNDPEDAVCAAFVHLKGSACKPILEGATGDAEGDYNNVPFVRDGNNTLMSALANYNGSGTRDGVPLAKQGRGQNPDYVRMGYWLIASGFTKTVDIDSDSDQLKDINQTSDGSSNSSGGGSVSPGTATTGSSSECSGSGSGGASGEVIQIDGFNYSFPLALAKNDVVHAADAWPCPGPPVCHHDGTPAFDLFKRGRGPDTEGTPVIAITDGTIESFEPSRRGNDNCNDWQLVGKDGYWYWYGHSSSATVQNGATVSAGQQIAIVGRSACADNTDPHLHIDRGPKGQYGGTVGNRDPEFVPLLNEIHERMPEGNVGL